MRAFLAILGLCFFVGTIEGSIGTIFMTAVVSRRVTVAVDEAGNYVAVSRGQTVIDQTEIVKVPHSHETEAEESHDSVLHNRLKRDAKGVAQIEEAQRISSKLMDHPHASLYSEEGFKGQMASYEITSPTDCIGLHSLNWTAKSVETFGTCIRLFENYDCSGASVAIYPGGTVMSDKILIGKQTISRASSLGPCLKNEFAFASVQNGTLVKDLNSSGIQDYAAITRTAVLMAGGSTHTVYFGAVALLFVGSFILY